MFSFAHTAHQVMLRCFFFFTTFGDSLYVYTVDGRAAAVDSP